MMRQLRVTGIGVLLIFCVTAAQAFELFPGYFVGWVEVKPMPLTGEVWSPGYAKYYTYFGFVNRSDQFYWDHVVTKETSGGLAINKLGSDFGEYSAAWLTTPIPGECYRARLDVMEGCVTDHWGSAEYCVPADGGGSGETPPSGGGTESPPNTPIVLDLENNGFRFTPHDAGVTFDFEGDGLLAQTAWTAPRSDEAFLVLDRNLNGRIDDGSELFGDRTPQPVSEAPNGFVALAQYDLPEQGGNGDGLISSADLIFNQLLLWRDSNHDGVSQTAEMEPLAWSGIDAIDLTYHSSNRRDRYGNVMRWASRIHLGNSWRPGIVDVIFTPK